MALTLLIILTYGVYRYFRHRKKLAELERLTNIRQDLLQRAFKVRGLWRRSCHKLISALIADKNRAQLEGRKLCRRGGLLHHLGSRESKMPIAMLASCLMKIPNSAAARQTTSFA